MIPVLGKERTAQEAADQATCVPSWVLYPSDPVLLIPPLTTRLSNSSMTLPTVLPSLKQVVLMMLPPYPP